MEQVADQNFMGYESWEGSARRFAFHIIIGVELITYRIQLKAAFYVILYEYIFRHFKFMLSMTNNAHEKSNTCWSA